MRLLDWIRLFVDSEISLCPECGTHYIAKRVREVTVYPKRTVTTMGLMAYCVRCRQYAPGAHVSAI